MSYGVEHPQVGYARQLADKEKRKTTIRNISKFLLDQCTDRYSSLWLAARSIGAESANDLVGKEEELRKLGVDDGDINLLEEGLRNADIIFSKENGSGEREGEFVEYNGRNYWKVNRYLYGLRDFEVRRCNTSLAKAKKRFKNERATAQYLLIDGDIEVPLLRESQGSIEAGKLEKIFIEFSAGKDIHEIVEITGLSYDTIAGYLTSNDVAIKSSSFTRLGLSV